jgi:hypothetical protein
MIYGYNIKAVLMYPDNVGMKIIKREIHSNPRIGTSLSTKGLSDQRIALDSAAIFPLKRENSDLTMEVFEFNSVQINMIHVNPGFVHLMIPDSEKRRKAKQEHTSLLVSVDEKFPSLDAVIKIERPFWLSETKVPKAMLEGKSASTDHLEGNTPYIFKPATEKSKILEFCNKLSVAAGFDPCYKSAGYGEYIYDSSKNGFRLPNSDEWLYAAIAEPDRKISVDAWYIVNSFYRAVHKAVSIEKLAWPVEYKPDIYQPVKSGSPNKLGFYNIMGNGLELTLSEKTKLPGDSIDEERDYRLGAGIFDGANYKGIYKQRSIPRRILCSH